MARVRAWIPLAAAASLLLARPASAQQGAVTGSLERFQPAPSGDPLFGVPSPTADGHLIPRATAIVDFAYLPLSIQEGSTRSAVVAHQTFLHLAASLALYDRLLVSVDLPFALAQGGDSPTIAGQRFTSPGSAQIGDLRLGGRFTFLGEPTDALQIAAGGYLYLPTGPGDSYAADGAVRFEPHLVAGGRYQRFLYSASLGTTLRASDRPHTFDLRAGAGVLLAGELLQLGPELSLSAPFSNDPLVSTEAVEVSLGSATSAELLLGAKLRPLPALVIGAGAGPGLTQGWGTPVFFAVGSVGYEPRAPRPFATDSDGDEILDPVDACPDVRGARSDDPRRNGCPPDRDADRIVDAKDACPNEPGVASDDPKLHGCPPAPAPAPVAEPPDTDGVPDARDTCPAPPGATPPEPTKDGCPTVTVTSTEIVIHRQVQFRVGQSTLDQTVDPVSDDLLDEVRKAILEHREIELIEVQGHTDVTGTEEFNQRLSQARANAVRLWLIQRGIPRTKLTAVGYGARVPIASNDTDVGRQQNRRVQFVIRKKSP